MYDRRRKNIGLYLETAVDDCDDCPLERICNEAECNLMWEKFFKSKVKERDIFEG